MISFFSNKNDKKQIRFYFGGRGEEIVYEENNKKLSCYCTSIGGLVIYISSIHQWESPEKIVLKSEERLRIVNDLISWVVNEQKKIKIIINEDDGDKEKIESLLRKKEFGNCYFSIEYDNEKKRSKRMEDTINQFINHGKEVVTVQYDSVNNKLIDIKESKTKD